MYHTKEPGFGQDTYTPILNVKTEYHTITNGLCLILNKLQAICCLLSLPPSSW